MRDARGRRALTALLVFALHLALLSALVGGGVARKQAPRQQALRWLPLRPVALPPSARPPVVPRANAVSAQPAAIETKAEIALPAPATDGGPVPVAEAQPAIMAPLELRPLPDGPRRRQALGGGSPLTEQLRSDPRSNSPRLGLTERFAIALGTPCFVDEVDAEGQPRRHEGQWVGSPDAAQQISQGVAQNLGVGGKAPPMLAHRCVRAH